MGILSGNNRRRWRSEQPDTSDPKRELQLKLWALRFAILGAFAILALQLANLQLMNGHKYEQRAALNHLRIEPILPSRGLIYDRNGIPVVENVPGYSAAVVAADVPDDDEKQLEIVGALERLLGVNALETSLKITAAQKSVDFADRSGDAFQRIGDRTTLADARQQAGDLSDAREYLEKYKLVLEFDRDVILAQLSRIVRAANSLFCDT